MKSQISSGCQIKMDWRATSTHFAHILRSIHFKSKISDDDRFDLYTERLEMNRCWKCLHVWFSKYFLLYSWSKIFTLTFAYLVFWYFSNFWRYTRVIENLSVTLIDLWSLFEKSNINCLWCECEAIHVNNCLSRC